MGDKIRLEQNEFEDEEYEPTDSEEEYSEGEKELLREARQRRTREDDDDTEKQLMAFDESDDDDDEDEDEDEDDVRALMRDSDIEGAQSGDDDDLRDNREWGKKSRNYYNTDFVDPDYSTYTAEQEEMAREEEEEAKKIQKRLAKQMKEEDFQLDQTILDAVKSKRTVAEVTGTETAKPETIQIKANLAGMAKADKLRLLQEDSPEFMPLTSDFKSYFKEADELIIPVLRYVRANKVPMIPALEFAEHYQDMMLTYCTNVSFYLLLKAKRLPVRSHPVTKRLLQLKKLIQQLQDKYDNIIRPQLEALLERIVDGDEFQVLAVEEEQPAKKKTKLGILAQYDNTAKRAKLGKGVAAHAADEDEMSTDDEAVDMDGDGDDDDEDEDELARMQHDENARRGITYQIAKNKGLMPARKKELRNPRVKHRNKFRKAIVRRKGAVRTIRTETKRYGGEVSGIKATVSKSIKFKT